MPTVATTLDVPATSGSDTDVPAMIWHALPGVSGVEWLSGG